MRIAQVLRRLVFGEWGGTEQVVWNLAKAQRAAGHEVRIFATDALCKTPRETRDGLEIVRFPCVYPWWPMPKRVADALDRKGGNPFVPGLGAALREWGPDVIHCHAMGRMAELCIRTAEAAGAKCVVSLHGGASNVPEAEARS
jgi:glycosyltransferase involved in cell wall biosynthesis